MVPSCYKIDWSGWTTRVDASDPTEIMRRMKDGNDVFIRKAEWGFALYGEGLDCSGINESVAQSVANYFAKSRGGWA